MDLSLDVYDDPGATVLCGALGGKELPAKLAAATLLSPKDLSLLPDRLFALVGTYEGGALRKFAMHDEAHLGMSILYFLANQDRLPEPVRQKVACNLVNACAWYETEPPVRLVKIALLGTVTAGLGLMAAPAKLREEQDKSRTAMDAFRAAQASGAKTAGTGRTVNSAWEELDRFVSGDLSTQNKAFNSGYPDPFDAKLANTTGTELGVQGAMKDDPRGTTPARRMAVAAKTSSWEPVGEISVKRARSKVAAEHYALPHAHMYPIDTLQQVKCAAAYFEEFYRDFEPTDRRVFAVSVRQRAEDLGVKVAGKLQAYGGDGYGSYLVPELEGRIRAFEGTTKTAAYRVLLDKRDAIPAAVMVEMLKKADAETGVAEHYGRPVTGFREPLLAVYEKIAEARESFSWSYKGHHVSEDTLNTHSVQSPALDPVLGAGFSIRYQRDPVAAFKSLTDEQKVVLSRLANAQASKTP